MTEIEKIAYAKSFIDRLANGINPLDNTPLSETDIANNVRISRCFFYVSDILREVIDEKQKKASKEEKQKQRKRPFSITYEQLQNYVYCEEPISSSAVAQKINWLVREDIEAGKMKKLSQRKITQWLLDIGMIEFREWEQRAMKRFPTEEGEKIGLVLKIWESYNRKTPAVYFTKEAQKFVIDNIDAVIATQTGKSKNSEEAADDNDSYEITNE